MISQRERAASGLRDGGAVARGGGMDAKGKRPIAACGEEEKVREEEKSGEAEAPSSHYSSSSGCSSKACGDHLLAIFCDVCGDPKPASDVCFDAVGCVHLFCFGCLSLRAVVEGSGDGDVVPCPVSGCRAGFLDQLHGGVPPGPVAVEEEVIVATSLAAEAAAEEEPFNYFCAICMETKPPGMCFLDLRGCDHVFCNECIAGYVEAKVGDNAVAIGCPDPGCAEGKLEPEACRPVIPTALFERWGAALCEAAVGEAARFYCPYRDCSALLWMDRLEAMKDAQCLHCGRVCCAQCRVPWHEGLTCEEYRRRAADREEAEKVMEMARERRWQRCPMCGFVVERVDGCVFIRCRCKHCFCYRCASPMDSNDTKHYCKKCQITWDDKKG